MSRPALDITWTAITNQEEKFRTTLSEERIRHSQEKSYCQWSTRVYNIFMECFCFSLPGVHTGSFKNFHNLVSKNGSYMFTKKSCIIKKIWKFSKLSSLKESKEAHEIKRKLHCLFKTLNEEELDVLLKTLQSNGGIESDCICIKPNDYRHISRRTSNFDPRISIAQAFRFPQMTDEFLRILPCCCNHNTCYENVCINPYHSSLVVDSGTS